MFSYKLVVSCIVILTFHLTLEGYCQVDLNRGLTAFYPFNGSPNDVSGNNRHGVLVNGVSLTTDRFGNANRAYYFDGVNDYIRVVDDGAFSTPQFSLVVWFKSESNALQNLVGKRDFSAPAGTAGAQYQMFINYSPFPGIGSNLVGNNSTCSNISASSYLNTGNGICINKWYCGVITFDGKNHKMYINGELKRDEPTSFNAFLSCNSELRFGNWWSGDLLPFKGVLDDIRWYNRALSADEVNAIYDGFPSAAPALNIKNLGAPCNGSMVNLTAPDVTAGSDAGLTFTYWRDAAATLPLSNPGAVGSGTYYIKASAGSNCSVIKPIIVTAGATPNLIINNPIACAPEAVDLTASSITAGSDGGLKFTYWQDAAGTVALPTTQAMALKSGGTYYIQAENISGCKSIKPVVVSISSPPTLIVSDPAPLCAPGTYDLSHSISSSVSGLTISYWKDALATIPIAASDASSIAVTGTYYIKANNASCSTIKSVLVNIKPQPFMVVADPAPVCSPATIDLTVPALISGSTPGLMYSYYTDNLATNPVSNPETVGSGTYFIKGLASNGCSSIHMVNATVIPKPTFTITPLKYELCLGEFVSMAATGGDSYQWFTKNNINVSNRPDFTFSPISSDSIFVAITSSVCQIIDTLGGEVFVKSLPTVIINKSNDIDCQTPSSQLNVTGGARYDWSPVSNISNPTSSSPLVYPQKDTWYKVKVTGDNNCVAMDSVLVRSNLSVGGGKFYVMNAFSPNGDGKNDCFSVKHWSLAVTNFELMIFDRWGKQLFYSNDITNCWNGTFNGNLQPVGTYIYQIKASSPCSEKPIYLKGHINLIR